MIHDLITALKIYEMKRALGNDALTALGERYGRSVAEIYSLLTFYTETSSPHRGRYKINLCRSLPCKMKRMDDVVAALGEELGIMPEGCTEDGFFSLHLVNCIGACDCAPAMLVNGELYGNLTPHKIREILAILRNAAAGKKS